MWMRTAALPTFRKLHRRVDHQGVFREGLPAGDYTVQIEYSILEREEREGERVGGGGRVSL